MARLVGALVVVAALLVPAAASAVVVPAAHYTAEIQGTDTFVGIVKRGDRFRAYVSNATAKGATLSVWFRGDVGPDGNVSATGYGVQLEADLELRGATGSVTLPDGRAFEFAAESGFGGALIERSYRHAGKHYLSGWIVLSDKRVRGRTSVPGTAFDGSSATGPGIRPSPPIGSQVSQEQRPWLCAQLNEDHEAVRTQRGRLLHSQGYGSCASTAGAVRVARTAGSFMRSERSTWRSRRSSATQTRSARPLATRRRPAPCARPSLTRPGTPPARR